MKKTVKKEMTTLERGFCLNPLLFIFIVAGLGSYDLFSFS